ncbi:serine/threonine protein kinase [Curtobacterium flaccumfaciens pv. flaccumfaciens]|uniref:serine/threonine-protein kinase n=1 Tax=Curtobacterium flaccumfaciens TaxID=2035 RepID=UPI00265B6CB1|nr:serine/threonine-protein kinase [Curtobacterium flaccumfaciens]MCS5508834.1 serine/threonine protein kinase [Curtobacterium flaccumfaciens pv. flaccumfaciens]MCX2786358.1 serine/threonine-protein kinase [Curtobacterium flaccumfaciens pv. flaccumfaciens]
MAQDRQGQYGQGEPLGASYRLVELLGTGATGEVWRVEHSATGEAFAAKLLRAELAADPQIVERFVRERSVLLALQHPSIVRVRDLVVEGDRLAIVMDLVPGGSARDLLASNGPLLPRDALTITAETLDALTAAHEQDVTHRDVKPDNVLLQTAWVPGATGAVRVTDFGIASVVAERERTTTGLLGTPQYMAPESISHGRSGPAADVYGAGVMLYELLSGRTPFAGPGTDFAVAYRHVTSNPPPLDVPDALWAAVSALLAKDPNARPSAAHAAGTLRRLARSLASAPALVASSDPDSFDEVERPATVVRGVRPDDAAGSRTTATGDDAAVVGPAPELGPAGSQTVIRPMARQPLPAAPAAEPEPTRRFARPEWLTDRALLFGGIGVVLVAALVVGGVVWLPGALRKTPGTGTATAQAANAYQQDRPLRTGLATTRRATVDPAKGTVDLRVTYAAQAATLSGPFLEVLPGARSGASCPAVTWSGEGITAKRNQPSLTGVDTACAWSLSGVEVPAGGDVTVEASVPLAVEDGAALQTWLDGVGEATTAAVTDDAVRGTAYPVQRLQGVEVRTPDRTVSQTALPVTLVPVWPNGADELNPLYRSPSSGRPSQMLVDVAGGESGVRFADGCSGALAVSSDGLVVTALSVAPSCTVRATVGNFTNLESSPFGITTRD